MNHEPSASFVLSTRGRDTPPLLERVDIDGRIDGLLFTSTVRQTWRHTGDRPLEAIYSFPLPPKALLLEFASVRGDERIEGTIAPRQRAEQVYEEALERGDAPILLEAGADGLHTANLGNLLPGETVVTEVRFVQLLRFEHGRLRLQVPTTIAPRYGRPSTGWPAPHQTPVSAWAAEYPLSIGLAVTGALASARLECPTHRHRLARSPGHTRFELEAGARLDRDVVVLLYPAEPRPALLLTARDPIAQGTSRQVALAAFELPRRPSNRPLSLKLLVDCSGSMAGDSMTSAKAALHGIADRLRPGDEVALMRFGDCPELALAPSPCTPATLQALREKIDATNTDLGGTQMERAIHHTLALRHASEQADVLVITDGQVWSPGPVRDGARRSGQRIFAIGVGSAPAEGLLRELATSSGGACEFATPGEDLQAASLRMIERMRDMPWHDVRVDWGCHPHWQSPRETVAFGGDTVIAMAVIDGPPQPLRARLELAESAESIVPAASEAVEAEVLARLVAHRRWPTQAPTEAAATSLRYRLLNQHTHCVMVHTRADRDRMKAQAAELVRVPQMLAAGWLGVGSARQAGHSPASYFEPSRAFDFEMANPASFSPPVQPDRTILIAPPAFAGSRDELASKLPPGIWKDAFLRAEGEPLPEPLATLMRDLASFGLDEQDAWRIVVWMLLAEPPVSVRPRAFAVLDVATRTKVAELVRQAIAAVGTRADAPSARRTMRLHRQLGG
jgi:Ca-activated chloride channel family protein